MKLKIKSLIILFQVNKYYNLINYIILLNIVITLGISGVGKTSMIHR
jgi:putative ribosome biogenesis GTPase RsgA